jgi:hemerythrin-like domain-containing protein
MIYSQPIKRSKELTQLSREHHDGLLLCWKINSGLKKGIEPERICRYIVHFFDNDLRQHFAEEELYIFPLLEKSNTIRVTVETQHQVLRDMINSFRSAPGTSADLLKPFAQLLNDHIRYEERTLFQTIEHVAKEGLEAIQHKLSTPHNRDATWRDQFWLN